MSYYPTEDRGGCMESVSRCCRQAYFHPFDTRKLLYVGGGVIGVFLVAVIWTGLSSSDADPSLPLPAGRIVLQQSPLVVGCNFFPSNLRSVVHNNVSRVKFDSNLKNDSLLGSKNCPSCQTDLTRLQDGLVGAQIWSIRVPCDAMYKDAVSLTLEQVDAMTRLIGNYPESTSMAKTSSDITESFSTKRVASLLSVSSGHSFDGRVAVLRTLYNLGVQIMSLTSNCSNSWASSYTENKDSGLSELGKVFVKEMNRLGMVIDLSEASHQTQLDVLNITKAPVIFSHAAAYGVTNNIRNVKDDVLKQLKINKGLLMVTFIEQYVNTSKVQDGDGNFNNIVEHINYVKNIIGVSGVGIGAEYDAFNEKYPSSLSDVSSFPVFFDSLVKNWTDRNDLKKLAGENLIRVLQDVEKVATDLNKNPADETYNLPINSSCYSDFDTRNTMGKVATTAVTPAAGSPTQSTTATQATQPTNTPQSSQPTNSTQSTQAKTESTTTNSTQTQRPT